MSRRSPAELRREIDRELELAAEYRRRANLAKPPGFARGLGRIRARIEQERALRRSYRHAARARELLDVLDAVERGGRS